MRRGRWEKAMSDKTRANNPRESYNAIVPAKQPNESQGGPKEVVEGRALTKENMGKSTPNWTQSREIGPSGLDRVRQAAKENKQLKFTALMHHVTIGQLRNS